MAIISIQVKHGCSSQKLSGDTSSHYGIVYLDLLDHSNYGFNITFFCLAEGKVQEPYSPEGSQYLEVYAFQDMFRCVQFDEEHDEDPMVRKLLELSVSNLVVLK